MMTMEEVTALDFERSGNGLVTVIAQHAYTGVVLMLGHANRQAVVNSLEEGVLWFYSRSRSELWRKGDTSGNTMRLVSLHADCDRDALLALVVPAGPACHTGARSCFGARPTLVALADTIAARAASSARTTYTQKLLDNPNLRLKKLGEEAVELALACAAGDGTSVAEEAADLVYHALVACLAAGVTLDSITAELDRRSTA